MRYLQRRIDAGEIVPIADSASFNSELWQEVQVAPLDGKTIVVSLPDVSRKYDLDRDAERYTSGDTSCTVELTPEQVDQMARHAVENLALAEAVRQYHREVEELRRAKAKEAERVAAAVLSASIVPGRFYLLRNEPHPGAINPIFVGSARGNIVNVRTTAGTWVDPTTRNGVPARRLAEGKRLEEIPTEQLGIIPLPVLIFADQQRRAAASHG